MPSDHFDISVVIPAKDEEYRLPQFLQTLIAYCQASPLRYEIIVVDDGSTDKTAELALTFQRSFPDLTLLSLGRNHGKGYAVKQGLLTAHGDIALFMDADGSTGPLEIEKNLKFLSIGYDIVIGSRVLQSDTSQVRALFYRRSMGWIFNFLVSTLLIKDIKDTQCGFKMFRREIIRPLWENIRLDGFGFDLEILFLAQRMNYKIKEVAVNWKHVENSKVDLIRDSGRMLVNIFQIRSWYSGRDQIS
jgi:dolichyl-phosphate beta-glucosyltransferase